MWESSYKVKFLPTFFPGLDENYYSRKYHFWLSSSWFVPFNPKALKLPDGTSHDSTNKPTVSDATGGDPGHEDGSESAQQFSPAGLEGVQTLPLFAQGLALCVDT